MSTWSVWYLGWDGHTYILTDRVTKCCSFKSCSMQLKIIIEIEILSDHVPVMILNMYLTTLLIKIKDFLNSKTFCFNFIIKDAKFSYWTIYQFLVLIISEIHLWRQYCHFLFISNENNNEIPVSETLIFRWVNDTWCESHCTHRLWYFCWTPAITREHLK